jgi:hypothetical protein
MPIGKAALFQGIIVDEPKISENFSLLSVSLEPPFSGTVSVFRTDQNGTIEVYPEGGKLKVVTEK